MEYTTKNIKDLWIKFFTKHKHVQIDAASVVPENDSSVLFTTAGMQPLVPYFIEKTHPSGKRLFNYQRCIRTNDIDEVGDDTHLTFFEMLGSWSLGDYFKKEAIEFSYEFLTSKDYMNLPINKIAVSCFEGNENAEKDVEAYNTWLNLGILKENIFYLSAEHNWWQLGEVGPCGPDSEMFYITDKDFCGPNCSPACDCGKYIEIWNDVFLTYIRPDVNEKLQPLSRKNIDTGMGLERTVCALNGYGSVYEIDAFKPAIKKLEELSGISYNSSSAAMRSMRIIADHIRAVTMILGDENPTLPSNVGRGYVLRRLIRRSVNHARNINIPFEKLSLLVEIYVESLGDYYANLHNRKQFIITELQEEIKKFNTTLTQGLKEFEKTISQLKTDVIDGKSAFRLYDTFGFPLELTQELAEERGLKVDKVQFDECYREHQELSRGKSSQTFKSGLGGSGEIYENYHTATHLLLAVLRKHFGEDVLQRGSNITNERMRFDFSFNRKIEADELRLIEEDINTLIKQDLKVECCEMTKEDAFKSGAIGIFDDKYEDKVIVYSVGDVSKEFCSGPHATSTGKLGEFKILKEESSGAGVRRIRAVLHQV